MELTPTSSSSQRQRFLGIMFILISAAAFGAAPIFAKYAYEYGTEPLTLMFLRFTLASGIMLIYTIFHNVRFPTGRILVISILMGGIGYAGQSFCYFTALLYAPAGTVAILLYLSPAMVTGLSVFFFKQKITPLEIIALMLALAGMICVAGIETGGGKPLGIVLGVLAAIIYSIYIITGSRIMSKTNIIASSTVIMMSAGAVYTVAIMICGTQFPTQTAGWSAIGGIVIISTIVAIVAFFEGLKRIGPVHSSMFSNLEPVVTIALA